MSRFQTMRPRPAAPAAIAPQFELAFSGWYWQITRIDVNPPEIRASKSLFATQLPHLLAVGEDHGAILSGYATGPGGHELRMIEREIDAGDEGRFIVQVAANADVIEAQEQSFEWALAATFLTLALALIGSTALAVRFGLRPLRVLQEGVASIRRGERNASPANFRRTSRRSRLKSISFSTPTGRLSSARALRSAISPTRSRRRSACSSMRPIR